MNDIYEDYLHLNKKKKRARPEMAGMFEVFADIVEGTDSIIRSMVIKCGGLNAPKLMLITVTSSLSFVVAKWMMSSTERGRVESYNDYLSKFSTLVIDAVKVIEQREKEGN